MERWVALMDDFNYEIYFTQGKDNVRADFLSRKHPTEKGWGEFVHKSTQTTKYVNSIHKKSQTRETMQNVDRTKTTSTQTQTQEIKGVYNVVNTNRFPNRKKKIEKSDERKLDPIPFDLNIKDITLETIKIAQKNNPYFSKVIQNL